MFAACEFFIIAGSASLLQLILAYALRPSGRGTIETDIQEHALREAVIALDRRRLKLKREAESSTPKKQARLSDEISQLEHAEAALLNEGQGSRSDYRRPIGAAEGGSDFYEGD